MERICYAPQERWIPWSRGATGMQLQTARHLIATGWPSAMPVGYTIDRFGIALKLQSTDIASTY